MSLLSAAFAETLFPTIKRRGLILILSAPSGVGKTTISKMLLSAEPSLKMSISMTTRTPRPGEQEGIDYHFVSSSSFEQKIRSQDFLEYAMIFEHYYGTLKSHVIDAISKGQDILLNINWQGAQQLDYTMRSDLVKIFILPPSLSELDRRIRGRGLDSVEQIQMRMSQITSEISHWSEYDYVVVNDNLDQCLAQIRSIIHGERLKRYRQVGLADFVNALKYQANSLNL